MSKITILTNQTKIAKLKKEKVLKKNKEVKMRGKRAEREPRQLKFNFEKKVEAEDEKIRKLAESLWGQAKDLEEHTDLSTQENHTLRFSYHVGELLATKTKQYRQVIHRMFELGYLVLKEKEPECYYIFKDPKLGLRLKDQIEGI